MSGLVHTRIRKKQSVLEEREDESRAVLGVGSRWKHSCELCCNRGRMEAEVHWRRGRMGAEVCWDWGVDGSRSVLEEIKDGCRGVLGIGG